MEIVFAAGLCFSRFFFFFVERFYITPGTYCTSFFSPSPFQSEQDIKQLCFMARVGLQQWRIPGLRTTVHFGSIIAR